MSREHYISETVLEAVSGGKKSVPIGGLSWQPKNTLQSIGLSSLQSKILCEKHNSGLSDLDNMAGTLIRVLNGVDKTPEKISDYFKFDGLLIERWLLKVLFGLVKSSSLSKAKLKKECLGILIGEQWPEGWGLYVPVLSDPQILNNEFYVELKINPNTSEILLASFRVAGVPFNLILGSPGKSADFGKRRPRGLIFDCPGGERRIEFAWPEQTNEAITFTKTGTTSSLPEHQIGWQS